MIYLYVKEHSITGLKYFGTTIRKNPFSYLGSGKYWKLHIKKHGKEYVNTIEVWSFDNQELCTDFALKFSRIHQIANSDKWANLKEEDGNFKVCKFSNETKNKMSISQSKEKNGFYGKTHSIEVRNKISEASFGRKHSDEVRKKMSDKHNPNSNIAFLGKKHSKNVKDKISKTLMGYFVSEETRKKQSESRKKNKWWTDGIKSTQTPCQPDENWYRGRTLFKKGDII